MIKACFINGDIISPQKAVIQINDLGLLRGFAIFDYCRALNYKPFLLKDYLKRFRNSAEILGLPLDYSDEELENAAIKISEITNKKEFGIRFLLTGGYTEDGFLPTKPNLIIITEDYNSILEPAALNGVKLMSYDYQRELPEAKTTNYLTALRLQKKKADENAYDILYYNKGKILELTRSNFFIVKGQTLLTPANNILKGITRKAVLEIAKNKFNAEERDIEWKDVFGADEAFLTSTGKKIIPVRQVDDLLIGRGDFKVTRELIRLFAEFETQYAG